MADRKTQRVRDPIHDLIVFRGANDVDQMAWRLVNTREFQRLRRIRQLGFSDLVFPGATHTRFSHCLGVFHTARQLLDVVKREVGSGSFDESRARIAAIAALLHDTGHGPFSHAFERVEGSLASSERTKHKKHEEWTAEIIVGDTEIRQVMDNTDPSLAEKVAALLKEKDPVDIYSSIVSSQFDADRLDYIRRDRFMTGTGTGGIDFSWLLDGLRVGKITTRLPGENDLVEVDGFYLNCKSIRSAEEYLLARFNLYLQVYMHKTTRAAEQMLQAGLGRAAALINDGKLEDTGLSSDDTLAAYLLGDRSLRSYLTLDDSGISAGLTKMATAKDAVVQRFASALHDRRLYKCFDAGEAARLKGGDSLQRFLRALQEKSKCSVSTLSEMLLHDESTVTLYGIHRFDEPGAFQKVLIEPFEEARAKDISEVSEVLQNVGDRRLHRVYAPNNENTNTLYQLWKEANP